MNWTEIKDELLKDFRAWCKRNLDHVPSAELENDVTREMIREMFGQYRQTQMQTQQNIDQMTVPQVEAIKKMKIEQQEAMRKAVEEKERKEAAARAPEVPFLIHPVTGQPLPRTVPEVPGENLVSFPTEKPQGKKSLFGKIFGKKTA